MKLAVIGLGSIGMRRLRLLYEMGHRGVLAYDIDGNKMLAAAIHYTADINHRIGDVWRAKPDAVFICTPAETHTDLARRFIKTKCALFIEKPLSTSMDGVDDLIAKSVGLVTMVACNWRFRPGVTEMMARDGTVWIEADVPIPPERRTSTLWDIEWHFYDLALAPGTKAQVVIRPSYTEPYRVVMQSKEQRLEWDDTYDADADYHAEMAHFLGYAQHGKVTCNPIEQAAKTLRLLLEMGK